MPSSKPALLRQLGIVSATALVVSNMIGTGIFTTTGFLAGDLGSPSLVMWIWVVGALCALVGAMCYSELGVNFPSSGGEYVYLTRAYGPTWGFMTGWVSFFAGFSGPIALAALAFSEYLAYFFPALSEQNARVVFGSGDWTFRIGWAQIVACALVAVFTVLNIFGVQRVARIQNVLTSVKVLVLVSFIALGFLSHQGSLQHFSMNAVRTSTTPLAAQFAVSLFFIYLAYSGWNAATYVAEELDHPSRTLPRALGIGTALVAALYILLNVVFIYAAPLEDMKGKVAVGAFTASRLFGPEVTGIFSGLMALSLMSTVNAMVTIGPRVYYAMAGNGAFLSSAAKVHPKYRTPGGGHPRAGPVYRADDADAVPATGAVHRLQLELLRRDERGVTIHFPPPRRLEETARSELRLSAVPGSVHAGRRMDDLPGHHAQTLYFAGDGGHARHRCGGVSSTPEIPRA